MRICHLIYADLENPWILGGASVRVHELYSRLSARHDITVISGPFPGSSSREVVETEGFRRVRVGSASTYAGSRLAYCRLAIRELMSRNWDLWVNDFSPFAPLLSARRGLRERALLTVHHLGGTHLVRHRPLVGPLALAAEWYTLCSYPNILTVSPGSRRRIARIRGRRYNEWPVEVIPNGVADEWFEDSPAREEPYILFFGRIDVYQKGLDHLLKAFAPVAAERSGIRLVLAGAGQEKHLRKVRGIVARLGLGDRVRLIGRVSQQELLSLARRCLFVCMPSRFEGWGIVATEAAAAGKAVLATDVEGLRDAAPHGEVAMLVPPNDLQSLSEGMRRLLRESELRRTLGARGRQRAREEFGWDALALRVEELYRRVADGLPTGLAGTAA